ncbi:MAG: EMC3/TMCO1 family protein [Candidatus Kariarchaeaceae archaeon]|jgi:uncharacterized membrane protein (DUF106 family)
MGLFDFLDPLSDAIVDLLINSGLSVPPAAVVVLLFVSLVISSFSGFVTRTFIDMDKMTKDTQEMMEHQKNKRIAMETEDKKLWIRVKRNEGRFLELQKSTTMARMIPSFITIGPFIFLFQTLRKAFQETENKTLNECYLDGNCDRSSGVVALLPFKVSDDFPFIAGWFSKYSGDAGLSVAGFGFWYFLSAVVLSTLLQRIFGINLTGMQNPMQQR